MPPEGGAATGGRWTADHADPNRGQDQCKQQPPDCKVATLGPGQGRLESVRELRRLPPPGWLRIQPGGRRRGTGALASSHPKATLQLSAPLPQSGDRIGERLGGGAPGRDALRHKMASYGAHGSSWHAQPTGWELK